MKLKQVIILVIFFMILFGLPLAPLNYHLVSASSATDIASGSSNSNLPGAQAGAEVSWSMAGANPQRTSWVPEGVNPEASSNFGVEWYRPIQAYIGQHVQLIAARDKIYVSTARGLYALDTATGNEVWRFDTEIPLGHSPTVVDNTVYVGSFDKHVYALNADTGSLIWVFSGAKGGFSTNPLVIEGKVLLGSRDGYFYAIDQNNGHLVWQYPAAHQAPLGAILYSAAYKDGKVFFAANDNYAYGLDVSNGTLLWRSENLPGDGYQAWWPVVYGNQVIFSAALSYANDVQGGPGTSSVVNVVAPSDPYYSQMHNFQYGLDAINTIQRDDVFHNGEQDGAHLGPEFQAGGSGDSTGITWSWARGATVVNATKATEYLENDGQVRVNRPIHKPWRRGVIVLNTANGSEYTFDSDGDGWPEYAPFLFAGTKSGNRYPPLVIPTRNINGTSNDVLYAQNLNTGVMGWGISRARLTAWQFGTSYIHAVGENFAIDEPFADSAGGSILYQNLCCDRVGAWTNLETNVKGSFWSYGSTLETIKLDWSQIQPWMSNLTPGYDQMWRDASMYSNARLWGNYGTMNGFYHNHGLQNPIVPYKGRLFVHRSNTIIAFGPNAVPLRRITSSETPTQYEANIKQEYPNVVKPLLPIQAPTQNIGSPLSIQDIQDNLDYQITKMLQKGHLQPGYYNGTKGVHGLANYFENPADTLYTLTQAYPYVSPGLQPDLEKYIKQHYKRYFEDHMYFRTGYWIDAPTNYDLNNLDGFGQLQPRTWMPLPPEVSEDIKRYKASTSTSWAGPERNIYAMWLFAKEFYRNDPAKLESIYNRAKTVLYTPPPNEAQLRDEPWVHNGYIASYLGFLNLQNLAGKVQVEASLRATVENQLNSLLVMRSNNFSKDHPWIDQIDWEHRKLNVARNFMYVVPELGDYLYDQAFARVKEAVDEYNWVAPYWVATRYEASYGEFASDNLYTHAAMFQAKAYILKEPGNQLLNYIDAPAFETGDLFYIQNLVAILQNPGYGFNLKVQPASESIKSGESATFIVQVQPTGGFTETVTVAGVTPPSYLNASITTDVTINPPGQFELTLTDTHDPSFSDPLWYTIPLTASGGDLTRRSTIYLLLNGHEAYLPLIFR